MAEFAMLMQEYKRLCDSQETCKDCVLGKLASNAVCCEVAIVKCTEEAERIIMQWAKANQIKTNRDKFKEVFGYNSFAECPVGWSDMEYKEEQDGN